MPIKKKSSVGSHCVGIELCRKCDSLQAVNLACGRLPETVYAACHRMAAFVSKTPLYQKESHKMIVLCSKKRIPQNNNFVQRAKDMAQTIVLQKI